MSFGTGLPWQQQYDTNTTQSGEITGWEISAIANPPSLYGQSQSIVAFGFVFVFSETITSCYRAPILADDTIGAWTLISTGITSNLNSSEFILVGSKLYAIGGLDNSSGHTESSAIVQYATIGIDGSIGSWTTAVSMPAGRRFGRLIIIADRLYYIGGQAVRYLVEFSTFVEDSKAEIFYADIDSNGVTGSWSTSANSLPQGRSKTCVALAGERLYVQGGEYNSNDRYQLYCADVTGNSIGSWYIDSYYENTNMQLSNACCVVTNSTLYIIGGGDYSSGVSTLVYWIGLTEVGGLESSGWSSAYIILDPITGRGSSTAVALKTKLHIIGGYDTSGLAAYILSAPFSGGFESYRASTVTTWLFTA